MRKLLIILLLTTMSMTIAFGQNKVYSCKLEFQEKSELTGVELGNIKKFDSTLMMLYELTSYVQQYETKYYIDIALTDRDFEIRLREVCLDMVATKLLSFGHYTEYEDGVMEFLDLNNGFTLLMRKTSDNYIIVENGFYLIAHLKLKYSWMSDNFLWMSDVSINDVMKVRDEYRAQSTFCDFISGRYEICHPCRYILNIYENNNYIFSENGLVISEGTWKREGNLLTFYEKDFGEVFTALIEKDGIISKRFFGDYSDEKYRIIPEGEYIDMTPWIPE